MNIFVLDYDVKNCVEYHCNSHVVKMILEYTQILSTVNRVCGLDEGYKPTHVRHPCVLWAGECLDNWLYLRTLCEELNNEFKYRFRHSHKSIFVARSLSEPPLPVLGKLTKQPQAIPNDVKCDDVVVAYRNYYIKYKQHLAKWYPREKPWWFTDGILLKGIYKDEPKGSFYFKGK